jgi:hypothetical protein
MKTMSDTTLSAARNSKVCTPPSFPFPLFLLLLCFFSSLFIPFSSPFSQVKARYGQWLVCLVIALNINIELKKKREKSREKYQSYYYCITFNTGGFKRLLFGPILKNHFVRKRRKEKERKKSLMK